MNAANYPVKFRWLTVFPLFVLFIGFLLMSSLSETVEFVSFIYVMLSLVAFGGLITSYIYQWRLLRPYYPKRLRNQIISMLIAGLLSTCAAIFGDLRGAAEFGRSEHADFALLGFLTVGGVLALAVLQISALSNMLFILTKGQSAAIRVLENVVKIFAWLIIFGVSYMAFVVFYSLHDPSTE
jgi:hypothetical protein